MRQETNPLIPFLPTVGLDTLIMVGALIFLGPKLAGLIKNIDLGAPAGGSKGDAGALPGTPGYVTPSTSTFKFESVSPTPRIWARVGDTINVTWTYQHLGPAGSYVAGIKLYNAFNLDLVTSSVTKESAAFLVNADNEYTRYSTSISFKLETSIPMVYVFDAWIRETNSGHHVVDKTEI
jgi:hypothetical protein